ncbi:M20/M25/M40 family metallo-hydrolase [Pontibacter diazotrophicus]|uniref:M20/M25/M40 family metallo-hydrolase n=1 Tax=Pontibacter diazotrophicus TaxID=1400979 RepID=A0A3D8LIE3_9BACT|nr:M20/M25/M40 family metallo-hydrolase [Pontibacter diazotrophicus]RDV17175.1 M20/M25/M40 family metallo-hydrolase [Pontibacter diazotrophicus]
MTKSTKLVLLGLLPAAFAFYSSSPAFAQSAAAKAPEEEKKVTIDKKYQNEIKALAKNPAVKSAFKTIVDLEPQTRQDHILLTEIPAPPFKEEVRGKKYAEMLKAAGADSVWIDEAGNAIGKRKGRSGKKTVVLEAHLDTVFPEGTDVKVKQKGDTLFAPGVADDTRGLALVLTVLKAMESAGIETEADVLFIGTVGEEGQGDLRGVKQLFSENGPKIDSHIAVDGWGVNGITNRGLGSHRYRITFKGPGGHSSGAFGLVNPHNALGRAIHYFAVDADEFTKEGIRATYNVGVISGGTSVNSIPFESWMEVDMRSESPERVEGIDKLLQAAVQRALKEENQMKRSGPDLEVDVKLIGDRPAGGIEPTTALVQRAMAATGFMGTEPTLRVGSTNSNIPFSKGIPAVTIGSGGTGGGAHALDEWWYNDKGYVAIQRALLLLLSETGVAKGKVAAQ